MHLSRRGVVATTFLAAIAVAVPMTLAATSGGGTPANKAVAAGSKTVSISPGSNRPILSATFRTSKPEDLLIGVSLECSILTNVVINGGANATTETSYAEGTVKVWVELDGVTVPIQDASAPPQDPAASTPGDASDHVTFCDRLHRRTVSNQESPADGLDGSADYQRTKSANAFNWVRLNAGSGIHTLVVKADLTTSADARNTAQAVIGNRTLVIEPTKLANDAVIG